MDRQMERQTGSSFCVDWMRNKFEDQTESKVDVCIASFYLNWKSTF